MYNIIYKLNAVFYHHNLPPMQKLPSRVKTKIKKKQLIYHSYIFSSIFLPKKQSTNLRNIARRLTKSRVDITCVSVLHIVFIRSFGNDKKNYLGYKNNEINVFVELCLLNGVNKQPNAFIVTSASF